MNDHKWAWCISYLEDACLSTNKPKTSTKEILGTALKEARMALSKKELDYGQRCLRIWQNITSLPMVSHHVLFAKAVEAEVRKQDEALILMLVERLERADKISGYANNKAAIKAGRTRLEGK